MGCGASQPKKEEELAIVAAEAKRTAEIHAIEAAKAEDERIIREGKRQEVKDTEEQLSISEAFLQKKEKDESEARARGKKVLVIATSPMKELSGSNILLDAFVAAYAKAFPFDTVTRLDLVDGVTLPALSAKHNQVQLPSPTTNIGALYHLKDNQ
eukprot:gene7859-9332_t